MSDPNRAPGDPIEETPLVDDVVGRAHEGLADAEAAQRDIGASSTEQASDDAVAVEPASVAEQPVVVDEPLVVDDASPAVTQAYAAPTEPTLAASEPTEIPTEIYEASASASPSAPADAVTTEYTPADAGATPTEAYPAPAPTFSPQPIFVQAPEAPRPRGNRGAAGGIGLIAALAFAALYLGAFLAIGLLGGSLELDGVVDATLGALTSWWLWIATAVFFLGFWLLGAIINTARWGHWVIWGLLVGVAAYGGHLVGQLFQAPFWQITRTQGAELLEAQAIAPLAFVAFVLGRELTVWFGAWVAARGRRISELNDEARREYERTLEAGPQLVRP